MDGRLNEIKPIFRSILLALGRHATEKEFRSDYFNIEGQSFNEILREFRLTFVQLCRLMPDVCRVWTVGEDVMISRVSTEGSRHMDSLTIVKKKKNKPTFKTPFGSYSNPNRSTYRPPTFSTTSRFSSQNRPNYYKPTNNSAPRKTAVSRPINNNRLPENSLRANLPTVVYKNGDIDGVEGNRANSGKENRPANQKATSLATTSQSRPPAKTFNKPRTAMPRKSSSAAKSNLFPPHYGMETTVYKYEDNMEDKDEKTNEHVNGSIETKSGSIETESVSESSSVVSSTNDAEDSIGIHQGSNLFKAGAIEAEAPGPTNPSVTKNPQTIRKAIRNPIIAEQSKREAVVMPIEVKSKPRTDQSPRLFQAALLDVGKQEYNDLNKSLPAKIPIDLNNNNYIDLEDYVTSAKTIAQPYILEDKKRLFFEIEIVEFNSPSQFVFQFNKQDLNFMMEELNDHYNNFSACENLKVSYITSGMTFAAYTNDQWYRVEVDFINDLGVFVSLVDYGHKKYVHISKLRYLEKTFMMPTRKAGKGSLFGVRPINGERFWCPRATMSFMAMTKKRKIYATIKAHDKNGNFTLSLVDSLTDCKRISKQLQAEGFAEAVSGLDYSMNKTLI